MITYELFFLHHACLHIQKLSYNSPRQWIPQNGFHSIHDYYDYDYYFIHHHQSIYFYDQLDLSWVVAGDTELNTMEDEQANAFRIWRKEYSCLIFAVNTYGIHLSLDNENNNKSNNHNHQQLEKRITTKSSSPTFWVFQSKQQYIDQSLISINGDIRNNKQTPKRTAVFHVCCG